MQEHACAAAESRPEPSLSVSLKLANVYFAPSALTPSLRPSHDPPRLDSTPTLHVPARSRTSHMHHTLHTAHAPPSHLNAPSTKSLRATPPRRAPSARRRLRRATS